uniref:Uncharacterized protein n=1 Tax=Trichogramma kaykai TaxID=54128 RepID=A0ABD2WKB8_9HYME
MLLGSRAYISAFNFDTLPRIVVQGVPIDYSSSMRCLGITLTPSLHWDAHPPYTTLQPKSRICVYSACKMHVLASYTALSRAMNTSPHIA